MLWRAVAVTHLLMACTAFSANCRSLLERAPAQLPDIPIEQLLVSSAQQNALLSQLVSTCHLLCACARLGELCSVPPAVQCRLAQRDFAIVAHSGRAALESAVRITFYNAEDPARVSGAILLPGRSLRLSLLLSSWGLLGTPFPLSLWSPRATWRHG